MKPCPIYLPRFKESQKYKTLLLHQSLWILDFIPVIFIEARLSKWENSVCVKFILTQLWSFILNKPWKEELHHHHHHHHHHHNHHHNGLPAYSHQSYSHQVGIWHHDKGWEHDTVTFPPCIHLSAKYRWSFWRKVIVQPVPNLNSTSVSNDDIDDFGWTALQWKDQSLSWIT